MNEQILKYLNEGGSHTVILKLLSSFYKLGLKLQLDEQQLSHYNYLKQFPVMADTIYWLDDYRDLWSERAIGMKGKMGSKGAVKQKLIRFLATETYRKFIDCQEQAVFYTKDDIMWAAEHYVKNYRAYTGYIVQADYFVYKKIGKEEHSRLKEILEGRTQQTNKPETYLRDL